MARDKKHGLEVGDITRITKLTKQRKLNGGKGFSYDYVKEVFNKDDDRSNDDIIAIGKELVAMRKRTMAMLAKNPRSKHRLAK